jgi:hypothetical protein
VTVTLHSYGVVDEMRAEMVGSDEAGSGADFSASVLLLLQPYIVTAFGPPVLQILIRSDPDLFGLIPILSHKNEVIGKIFGLHGTRIRRKLKQTIIKKELF